MNKVVSDLEMALTITKRYRSCFEMRVKHERDARLERSVIVQTQITYSRIRI